MPTIERFSRHHSARGHESPSFPPPFRAKSRNLVVWPLHEIPRLRYAPRRMTVVSTGVPCCRPCREPVIASPRRSGATETRACSHYALSLCRISFFVRQDAASAVWLIHMSERQRRPEEKENRPFGLCLSRRHPALRLAHLESPNYAPRALIGDVTDTTEQQRIV